MQKIIEHVLYDMKRSFRYGVFHFFFSSVFIQLLRMVSRILIVRFLTPSQVGNIGVISTVINFTSIMAGFGINASLLKYISESISFEEKNKILFHSVVLSLIFSISITLFLFLFLQIPHILSDSVSQFYLKFFIWILPFKVIFNLLLSLYHGEKKIKMRSIVNFIQMFILLTGVTLGTFLWKLNGYVFSNIFIFLITGILSLSVLMKRYNITHMEKSLIKKLMKFAIFSLFANEFALIVSTADILSISYLLKSSTSVAYYFVAVSLMRSFRLIPSAITQTALPYISERSTSNNKVRKMYYALLKKMAILMFFVILILYFIGGPLIVILFGKDYAHSIPLLKVLLIGLFFWSLGNVGGVTLLARGRPDLNFYTVVIEGIINIVLNILLIKRYGIIGAAVSTSFTYFLRFIINLILCRKELKGGKDEG